MRNLPDDELMKRVKRKERQALSELYDRYAGLVYSFAWRALNDEAAAREIVQAVFLRLWTTESEYDPEKGRFSSWMLTIARRLAIDRLRRQRKEAGRTVHAPPETLEQVADRSETPEESAMRGGFRRRIRDVYRHLSDQQVQLLEQFYLAGIQLERIGGTLRPAARHGQEPASPDLENFAQASDGGGGLAMTGARHVCERCLEYVAGELDPAERVAFEGHLPGCPDCRREIAELGAVWEALQADMERKEPPRDLKSQVFAALDVLEGKRSPRMRPMPATRRKLTGLAVALAAIVTLVAGLLWRFGDGGPQQEPVPVWLENALAAPAAEMERLVPLRPAGEGAGDRAYGFACIVRQGEARQLVVYVFGARRTSGEEAYQVWLIRGGERQSAGTFRVDGERGIGVLAIPVRSGTVSFDTIGITLEPDARGSQPRGPKMFETGEG